MIDGQCVKSFQRVVQIHCTIITLLYSKYNVNSKEGMTRDISVQYVIVMIHSIDYDKVILFLLHHTLYDSIMDICICNWDRSLALIWNSYFRQWKHLQLTLSLFLYIYTFKIYVLFCVPIVHRRTQTHTHTHRHSDTCTHTGTPHTHNA